ncbi:MAG: AAA family ATPase [Bryobacteraceae bacterium]
MAGRANVVYEFGPFRLDPGERWLLREGRPVPLRAKVFDTLCILVEHRGRLIGKDDLMKTVWPDSIVEENNLAHNISVIRKALGDRATGKKYVETVPGQGYRFAGDVIEKRPRQGVSVPEPRMPNRQPAATAVYRGGELQRLHRSFEKALGGARQVLFVAGEAGIGKSLLVDTFLQETHGRTRLYVGFGQCLEHRGDGEAYMPVLAALGRMCREAAGPELIAFMAKCAPTWLVQMPWLVNDTEFAALRQRVLGATRDRMLREMVEAIETLTAGTPLLLVIEDLHWSDHSTVDLLAHLARRREPARLLLIGTYRPGDVRMRSHPLENVIRDLRVRGLCEELPLEFLDEAGVEEYLSLRFNHEEAPAGLARMLHQRTEGNPLFMVNVVDQWISQGLLQGAGLDDLNRAVPDTLRQLIEQQLGMAVSEDREILEAASVAGRVFSAAALAAGIGAAEDEVEIRCDRLARGNQFLTSSGTVEWPDGTVSGRYGFVHDLHREVFYERIPPGRKARLHLRIGARLEAAYGGLAPESAAELALHFIRGRDAGRATLYLWHAAEQCLARSAHKEAIEHLTTGLGMLQSLPDSEERVQRELAMQTLLAPALLATRGWSAPEAEKAYVRAGELCRRMGDPKLRPAVLVGLATLREVRGEYRQSQALMEERLRISGSGQEAELLIESHELLACSLFHQGAFSVALDHAEQGLALYRDDSECTFFASYGDNPAVSCHNWAAFSLWFLGYPESARKRAGQALVLARSHAYCLAYAQTQAALVHLYRREPAAAGELAQSAISLATERGFPYRAAVAAVVHGWATAVQGQRENGLTQLRQGIAGCRAAGANMDHPFYLALLAEAYALGDRPEEGLHALAEAFAMVRNSRTFFYEAELHRLWGCLLLQAGTRSPQEAEASFQLAIETARRQKARCLELRAAVNIGRQWRHRGRRAEARQLLAETLDGFTEGFDTPDLREAAALLEELTPHASAQKSFQA